MKKVTIVDVAEVWDGLTPVQQRNLYNQMRAMSFRNQQNIPVRELSSKEEVIENDTDQQN